MELALFVYLAGVAGSISALFAMITVLAIVTLPFHALYVSNRIEYAGCKFSDFKSKLLTHCFAVFFAAIIAIIIPSEKTMYLMLAGYTTQEVIQSDTGNKVQKIINAKLDEYLEEATKGKEKK